MKDYCVELHEVHKRFAGPPVLDGISLSFEVGCTTALVGESGSGKTTLLQLANAVVRPDAGEVRVTRGVPTELINLLEESKPIPGLVT